MMIRRGPENAQAADGWRRKLGRPGASVLAGAALLAVGVVGFSATARYDHSDFGFAPLEPVGPLSVRDQGMPDFGGLVVNLGGVTLGLPAAEASDEPIAESVTESAQRDEPNHVVAAAANPVTILPPATVIATAAATLPPSTPTVVASPSPTPTAVPILPPAPATRSDGTDNPVIRPTAGSSGTLADHYGAGGEAGEAPQINSGPTVSLADTPRAIDPTRPMPR